MSCKNCILCIPEAEVPEIVIRFPSQLLKLFVQSLLAVQFGAGLVVFCVYVAERAGLASQSSRCELQTIKAYKGKYIIMKKP